MRSRDYVRLTLALALSLAPACAARGPADADVPAADPEPAADRGFPWLCFATSVAALTGLYVLVRRRERATDSDRREGRGPEAVWYCQVCDRDVSGPACPRCRASCPFADEPGWTRTRRHGH
jgi:hypothetical protein